MAEFHTRCKKCIQGALKESSYFWFHLLCCKEFSSRMSVADSSLLCNNWMKVQKTETEQERLLRRLRTAVKPPSRFFFRFLEKNISTMHATSAANTPQVTVMGCIQLHGDVEARAQRQGNRSQRALFESLFAHCGTHVLQKPNPRLGRRKGRSQTRLADL